MKLLTAEETNSSQTDSLPAWRGHNQIAAWHIQRGEFGTARELLLTAISRTDDMCGKVVLTKTLAHVLCEEKKYDLAIALLENLDRSQITDELDLAKLQHTYANVLDEAGYFERSLVQLAGAGAYFELAGHPHRAEVNANTGSVLIKMGRADEAHPYIDKAESFFRSSDDHSTELAQTLETRARAFLAENRPSEALEVINESLSYLTDEKPLLIESLTTKGRAHARLKQVVESMKAYRQAIELTESIGQDARGVELEMYTEIKPAVEWNIKRLAIVLGGSDKVKAAKLAGVTKESVRLWVKSDPSLGE